MGACSDEKKGKQSKKEMEIEVEEGEEKLRILSFFIAVYTNKYKKYAYFVFFEKNKYTNAYYFRIKCYICSGNYILSICR